MKLKTVITCLLSLTLSATYAQSTPRDTLTDYYYKYPQQAIKKADLLYQEAIKTQNTPLLIKALILKTAFTIAVDQDEYPKVLNELERYISQEEDLISKAVLSSYCSQLYVQYYNSKSYIIDQRSFLKDSATADIDTWSANLFTEKIKKYTRASLAPAEALQKTPLTAYREILTPLTPADSLRPTLYDFLCYRAMDIYSHTHTPDFRKKISHSAQFIAPASEFIHQVISDSLAGKTSAILKIWQSLLKFRLEQQHIPALLYTDLKRLEYAKGISDFPGLDSLYLAALQELEKKYLSTPYVIEIMAKEANERVQALFSPSYPPSANRPQLIARKQEIIDFCEKGIQLYPKYKRINLLHAVINRLKAPELLLDIPSVLYPDEVTELKLQSQNLKNATLQIYRIDLSTEAYESLEEPDKNTAQHKIYETYITLPNSLIKQDSYIQLPPLQAGLYKIILRTPEIKNEESQSFFVTRLYSNYQAKNRQQIFSVYDWQSGKPIANAKILLYKPTDPGYTLLDTLYTNRRGMAISFRSLARQAIAYQVVDQQNPNGPIQFISRWYANPKTETETQTAIFTDRKIYRPGQTVYYKGIIWKAGQDTLYALSNQKNKVSFRNADNKEIAQQQAVSNPYGSFTGSFTIPPQTLNGQYFITTGTGETTIEVAEYKRPEFEIVFSQPTKTYRPGDTVQIRGQVKSFSGIKIAHTEIHYEISIYQPFGYYSRNKVTLQGITHSDADGNFEISFKAQDMPASPFFRNTYIYQIKTKVTDMKGETEEAGTYLSVYSERPTPTLQVPGQVNKMLPTAFKISFQNLNTDSVPRIINYTLAKVAPPSKIQLTTEIRDTVIEKIMLEGKRSVVRQDSIVPDLTQYPSGIYLFTVEYEQTKIHKIFFLYSLQDHQPPYPTYEWIVKEKTTCYPGDTARILFGTSAKDAYVRYDVYSASQLIKRDYPVISNGMIRIAVPYKAEYGNQIWVYISYVKDKNFISEIIPVRRLHASRRLTIETRTFRDKLTPGEEEEWTIKIRDAGGKPVTAELLAMMYDASLDKIMPYQLHFAPEYIPSNAPYTLAFPHNYKQMEYIYLSSSDFKRPSFPVKKLDFSQLQTYTLIPFFPRFYTTGSTVTKNFAVQKNANYMDSGVLEESVEDAAAPLAAMKPEKVELRENFAETAFFYPQLQSDAEGNVNFHFTVPEATTQWKFIALATTPELAAGTLFRTVTTSKPLTVRPNVPRFLRSGDQTNLKTTVSNLSDTLQQGVATLELFAPQNQKIIISRQQHFTVEPQGSQTLDFQIPVPENTDLIGFRIIARSGNFSDGEQHLLPVLPDKTLVTQTLPIYSTKPGSYSFTLNPPARMQEAYRLTFEMAANPVWYAVLALPALQDVQNDNATDLSAAYYVNCITHSIIEANPHIAAAIRNWQTSADDPTLLSKLEQNQELKAILLESSPWVMQAQTETEQMQSLFQLFDANRLNYLQRKTVEKLADLQNKNGGWSWFKGMYPNRFMTANILTVMARTTLIGCQSAGQKEKGMQIKALRYLDNEIRKDYQDSVKKIHYDQIIYLYTRSFYRDIPLGDALKAHKYFMALLQKQWGGFSLYEKALAGIALNRYGFTEEARNVLQSLRQYAVVSPDQGMFWPNNQRNMLRNSAIQVHTAILEAFYELEGRTQDVELMKQWLLRQKQTQYWGNVPSTVDAIYALLLTGNSQLDRQEELTVRLGDEKLISSATSSPLGYIKKSYPATEIKPEMFKADITKTTDSPSWGGLYLQYFEKFDRIQKQKGDLRIDKKLFIEKQSPDGRKELVPIQQQNLKTGDKVIVRLTLSLSRDMDFLYVKDFRAACFEPVNSLSGNQWRFGTVYYEETKDAVTNFFFNSLAKGTYILEYPVWVNQAGIYQDGIAIFQNMYAPEYTAYSTAAKITVTH